MVLAQHIQLVVDAIHSSGFKKDRARTHTPTSEFCEKVLKNSFRAAEPEQTPRADVSNDAMMP